MQTMVVMTVMLVEMMVIFGDLELLGDDARFRLHCISSCEVAALLSGKRAMSRSPP